MTLFGIKIGLKALMWIALAVALLLLVTAGPAACSKIRSLTAQNKINEGQHGALVNSAGDAVNTVGGVGQNTMDSEGLTRRNEEEIRNAEGAGNSVSPAVNDAFLRAACRRASSRNDPKCRLLQPNP